jgi:hypothetical protein
MKARTLRGIRENLKAEDIEPSREAHDQQHHSERYGHTVPAVWGANSKQSKTFQFRWIDAPRYFAERAVRRGYTEKPVSDRGTTEDLSQSAESRTLTSQRLDFVLLRFGRELRQLRPVPLRVLRVTENSGDSRLVRVERWAARQQLTHEYFQQTLSGLIADPPMAKAH